MHNDSALGLTLVALIAVASITTLLWLLGFSAAEAVLAAWIGTPLGVVLAAMWGAR